MVRGETKVQKQKDSGLKDRRSRKRGVQAGGGAALPESRRDSAPRPGHCQVETWATTPTASRGGGNDRKWHATLLTFLRPRASHVTASECEDDEDTYFVQMPSGRRGRMLGGGAQHSPHARPLDFLRSHVADLSRRAPSGVLAVESVLCAENHQSLCEWSDRLIYQPSLRRDFFFCSLKNYHKLSSLNCQALSSVCMRKSSCTLISSYFFV